MSTNQEENRYNATPELAPVEFRCSICFEAIKEATATICGHSFCRGCITRTVEVAGRCPTCGAKLEKNNVFPNYALCNVIQRSKRLEMATNSPRSIEGTGISESTSVNGEDSEWPDKEQLTNLLMTSTVEDMEVNELDELLQILQQKREVKATEEEELKQQLSLEFLEQLNAIKRAQWEDLLAEVDLINHDINKMTGGADVTNVCQPSSLSSSGCKDPNFQAYTSEAEQSFRGRQCRMAHCFEELTQMYFNTRNGRTEAEDPTSSLKQFATTLSHLTQYNLLKPLATLNYNPNVVLSKEQASHFPCLLSSIAFDKDSEFFAVASNLQTIKVFEYANVVGGPQGSVKFHIAELSLDSKVSCVAWNNYYKNRLASAAYDGKVSVWDVSVNSKIWDFTEHEKRTWSVDWSSEDPRLLLSGSDDTTVKLWSANCEASVSNLKTPTNVCSVKFRPGSSYSIAFGSANHCVYLYDLRSPKEPHGILCGHKKTVSYVQFVRTELLSASIDDSMKLWDLGEGITNKEPMSCVRSFRGHVNVERFVGLDTDGNYIACGSENNAVYVYYKQLAQPLFAFKFESFESTLSGRRSIRKAKREFVSAVAWRRGFPVVVAANSRGIVKILELA